MTQQYIDIGTGPGVGDGDPLRIAFDKINQNFDEIYSGEVLATSNIINVDMAGKITTSGIAFSPIPATSKGQSGDKSGMISGDANFFYYCVADYDGSTDVWKRIANDNTTW